MQNVLGTTNNVEKAKMRINHVKPGHVFFHAGHAFIKLANPFPSALGCSLCGQGGYNAHNFSNAVHFCTNQDYQFDLSDFTLSLPQDKPGHQVQSPVKARDAIAALDCALSYIQELVPYLSPNDVSRLVLVPKIQSTLDAAKERGIQ